MSLIRELWRAYQAQPRKGQWCRTCQLPGHLWCSEVAERDVTVLAVYTEIHSALGMTEEAA